MTSPPQGSACVLLAPLCVPAGSVDILQHFLHGLPLAAGHSFSLPVRDFSQTIESGAAGLTGVSPVSHRGLAGVSPGGLVGVHLGFAGVSWVSLWSRLWHMGSRWGLALLASCCAAFAATCGTPIAAAHASARRGSARRCPATRRCSCLARRRPARHEGVG